MSECSNLKEVYFDKYCYHCKHWKVNENGEPCDECLANPGNEDSHKPVFFKEAGGED